MTTPAHRLPIHGQCHHDHHQAQRALTDVRAALSRAGYSDPDTTAAELVDQLGGKLRALAQDYADATSESLSDVAAMRGIRLGSPAGSTQDTAPPAKSHTQSPVDPGAGDPIGGTLPTAHSGPVPPPAAHWRSDQ